MNTFKSRNKQITKTKTKAMVLYTIAPTLNKPVKMVHSRSLELYAIVIVPSMK